LVGRGSNGENVGVRGCGVGWVGGWHDGFGSLSRLARILTFGGQSTAWRRPAVCCHFSVLFFSTVLPHIARRLPPAHLFPVAGASRLQRPAEGIVPACGFRLVGGAKKKKKSDWTMQFPLRYQRFGPRQKKYVFNFFSPPFLIPWAVASAGSRAFRAAKMRRSAVRIAAAAQFSAEKKKKSAGEPM